jgi:hypothetical protein
VEWVVDLLVDPLVLWVDVGPLKRRSSCRFLLWFLFWVRDQLKFTAVVTLAVQLEYLWLTLPISREIVCWLGGDNG